MIQVVNEAPLVSVILPFYNSELTLDDAIASIASQSFTDFELLLINNASTDKSSEIARNWTQRDSRIKLLNEKEQGVVFAANKGLDSVQGKYVARMDADDVSMPDRIYRQVQILEERQSIGFVSGLVAYGGNDSNQGFKEYVAWSNGIVEPEDIELNQFVEYPIVNPTILFKKELHEKFGGYSDGNFPEDYEFFLRLQSAGVKMVKTNTVVLRWNDLPNRLTRKEEKYSQEAFFKIKAKYLALWLEKNNPYHPDVVIWGGGRLAKRWSSFLAEYAIVIKNFIDIKKYGSSIYYQNVELYRHSFILSYVSNRGVRDEIRDFLNTHSFLEGRDYLICT